MNSIAVSGTSIYIIGSTNGTATFGSITSAPGANQADYDGFVAKLTDAGSSASWSWVQRLGGAQRDYCSGVAVNGSTVYVVGTYTSLTLVLGPTVLTTPYVGVAGYAFVARLNDLGTSASVAWGLGMNGRLYTKGIAVDNMSVYVTGQQGGSGFGNVDSGGFVGKLTDAGTSASWIWALPLGYGRNNERDTNYSSSSIGGLTAGGGEVYLVGYSSGKLMFDSTVLPAGTGGLLVARLADAGASATWQWVKRYPTNAIGAAVVRNGADLYAAGSFGGILDLGNTVPQISAVGGTDVFVAKLASADGSGVWTRAAGGPASDDANGLVLGSTGRLYVAGTAMPSAQFGSFALTGTSASTSYLAALDAATPTATASAAAGWAIGLSPNPAHGRATIQLPPISGTSTATITLLDALGRPLRTQTAVTNSRAELDLTGLPPGLYAVRVQAGGSTATRRLVVD